MLGRGCPLKVTCFFLLLLLIVSSCAKYEKAEIKTIVDDEVYIGSVKDQFVKYFPIRIIEFPDKSSKKIKIYVEKSIKNISRYGKIGHDEQVYRLDGGAVNRVVYQINEGFKKNPLLGLITLAFSPIGIILESSRFSGKEIERTKSEDIPGSSRMIKEYDIVNMRNIPAHNVVVSLEGCVNKKTNEEGVVEYFVDPTEFDHGLMFVIRNTNDTFLIKRESFVEKYKTNLGKSVENIFNVCSTAYSIYKIGRVVFSSTGVTGVIYVVVSEAVGSIVIGYIVDELATERRIAYRWHVVKCSK